MTHDDLVGRLERLMKRSIFDADRGVSEAIILRRAEDEANELLASRLDAAVLAPGMAERVAALIQRQVMVLEEEHVAVSSQGGCEHVARNLLKALPELVRGGGNG